VPPGGSFCMEGGHPLAMDAGGGPPPGNPQDVFGPTAYAPNQSQNRPDAAPAPQAAPQGTSTPAPSPDGRRTLAGFLVSYQDDSAGKFWPLYQGKNSIGRADTGQKIDIEIAHGTTSTHHASVDCEGQRFVLSDLGSTNGTFHNEEAVGFQGKRELRDGDRLRFGGYSVVLFNVVART
jgi:pSer/pThr/pTyr-binding forkhead associated (FHA) protein